MSDPSDSCMYCGYRDCVCDKNEEIEDLRKWIKDCRDILLMPLSHQDSEFGRVAEGLGQQTVKLLDERGPGGKKKRNWK